MSLAANEYKNIKIYDGYWESGVAIVFKGDETEEKSDCAAIKTYDNGMTSTVNISFSRNDGSLAGTMNIFAGNLGLTCGDRDCTFRYIVFYRL